ncbi:PLC-like phosphodiesterase [Macrolepiota fuliginosa MF-IS2]|uniref:Phosphoinositide phospholipase C n=1 Tax=Macrolepiota fuliginosa MF-IS2 TaxID=1400762 RepID=A0A9P5X1U8_9AGAR|nr:PLC-like phosphodiesterase [Macrolepiota fuliginosa MF-IS2]
MGRILVMVEYYPPLVVPTAEEAQDSSYWPHKRSSVPQYLRIGPTLAAVGYYLRSMKPSKNWFTHLYPDPPHILLNISESSLLSLLKSKTPQLPPADNILMTLITHAQSHIRRIYPKGLRLTSSNLHPHPFWGSGSHVVALNWQTYDLGIQLNEAMFAGTNGWAAKPAWMRGNDSEANAGEGEGMRVKVKGEIVGVCSSTYPSFGCRG